MSPRAVPEPYAQAIDGLQAAGFRTFLARTSAAVWRLRWERKGAKWATSSATLGGLGANGLGWLDARARGTGHEGHYAQELGR